MVTNGGDSCQSWGYDAWAQDWEEPSALGGGLGGTTEAQSQREWSK